MTNRPRVPAASNGFSSDGSLMNVGNKIWDPEEGGKPSIKLFPQYSTGAQMIDLIHGQDPDCQPSPPQHCRAKSVEKAEAAAKPKAKSSPQRVASSRDMYAGSAMAGVLGGESTTAAPSGEPPPARERRSAGSRPAASAAPDEFVQAALYRAVQEGNMKLVKLAVESDGANINGANEKENKWTALHYASHQGHCRIVEYLLKVKGIDKSIPDANGSTAAAVAKSKDIEALINA